MYIFDQIIIIVFFGGGKGYVTCGSRNIYFSIKKT
uniref:Uncharacterized protein n=1 Tax=Anguilla anguilla TaxID=7936 RepID=A0A0E9RW36_ANGAN